MSHLLPTYVTISSDASFDLSREISSIKPDKIAVLVDENTKANCLDKLSVNYDLLIEVPSGESHKHLSTCNQIWEALTSAQFSRKSLLINLGGGVIGDMGGFAGSTYKRGISFINVPTTLLSQVDASIGGKLGVDFNGLKNHIGLFQDPDAVIIDIDFLATLPEREVKSGFAEVIKHSLIYDQDQWELLQQTAFGELNWNEIVPKSVAIKNEIVGQDPLEGGIRKILNFGHTLGHAIETHLMGSSGQLLHGEAVAVGMILEGYISLQLGKIDAGVFEEIADYIATIFELPETLPSYEAIQKLLHQDKKNEGSEVRFALINGIGSCEYDVVVTEEMIRKSLKAYDQMKRSS